MFKGKASREQPRSSFEIKDDEHLEINFIYDIIFKNYLFPQVSAAIPPSFFQLCELLEGMIPDCVHPLCDSVIAHIMIRNMSDIANFLAPFIELILFSS